MQRQPNMAFMADRIFLFAFVIFQHKVFRVSGTASLMNKQPTRLLSHIKWGLH